MSRDGYRPRLTAEGQVFFPRGQPRSGADAGIGCNGYAAARAGGARAAACRHRDTLDHLLPVMAEIGQNFPATHLRLSTEMMGGPIARLMEGRADLVIATLDGVPLDEVKTRRLTEVTIRPVACPEIASRLSTDALSMLVM